MKKTNASNSKRVISHKKQPSLGKRTRSSIQQVQEEAAPEGCKSAQQKRGERGPKRFKRNQADSKEKVQEDQDQLMKDDSQDKLTQSEEQHSSHIPNSMSLGHAVGGCSHEDSQEREDSCSLTASDFEVLDAEHFLFQRQPAAQEHVFDLKSLSQRRARKRGCAKKKEEQVVAGGKVRQIKVKGQVYDFELPAFDKNVNYFDEYMNIFMQNDCVLAKIEKMAQERNEELLKIFKIESFYQNNLDKLQSERYSSGRKKHIRRCANDIEKKFKCPYQKCEKLYGSEGSLNLHIKIKHNGGNKTEREKLAKNIVYAKFQGQQIPEQLEVNLPPGLVERAATQVGIQLDCESLKQLEEQMHARNERSIKQMKELEILKSQGQPVRAFQDSSNQLNIQKNFKRPEAKQPLGNASFFNSGVRKSGDWADCENNENMGGEETSILMKNDLGRQIGDPKEWLFPQKPVAEKENSVQLAKLNKSFNAMNIYLQ